MTRLKVALLNLMMLVSKVSDLKASDLIECESHGS